MQSNLIITGIPRSGTSYLCSILNKIQNTVIINEPEEVFQIMHNKSNAGLSHYYGFIRDRLKNNLPISNKIVNGEFIEDTNVVDVRSDYMPDVDASNFLLGTKNTLIYLNTLNKIREDMPGAHIVACVRHPYDTVASWSNVSFPHIRNAEPRLLLDYVGEKGRESINRILQKKNLAKRYAMWWDYLARIIIKTESGMVIVRYEDLVVNPRGMIETIYKSAGFPVVMKTEVQPSSPRSHREKLDSSIIDAIKEHCFNSAGKLGYELK